MPKITIVRGLPGSGKSTHAKSLGVLHVEADMFHMVDGVYNWKPDRVKFSHNMCKSIVQTAITSGIDVAVSNTFTQVWEFKDYIDYALSAGYTVEVVRCTNDFGNVHNVPEESLRKMAARFEDYDGEIIRNVAKQ